MLYFILFIAWTIFVVQLLNNDQDPESEYRSVPHVSLVEKLRINLEQFDPAWHEILMRFVPYYAALKEENQLRFQRKLLDFLKRVEIFPIDFQPVDKDYLFVAGSAVLPVLFCENWMYPGLKMVILHQHGLGTFKDSQGNLLHTAGVVEFSRAPDRLHLSREVMWHDFIYDQPSQAALHEFMHILDYTDRVMDGVPLALMDKKYVEPWITHMMEEMSAILANKSNMNSYAGESRAEFLATTCEYYFKQPHILADEHPELFRVLDQTFREPLGNSV